MINLAELNNMESFAEVALSVIIPSEVEGWRLEQIGSCKYHNVEFALTLTTVIISLRQCKISVPSFPYSDLPEVMDVYYVPPNGKHPENKMRKIPFSHRQSAYVW